MEDYRPGFQLLYNAITDTLRALAVKDLRTAEEILCSVQKKVDELYAEEDADGENV